MNINGQKKFKDDPKSYWLDSTPITNYPSLNEDINVDIVIIGGGLAGISCAYLLKNEGFNIAILEANSLCEGTTAYTTAKITSQHGLIYNKLSKQMGKELASQYAEANEYAIKEINKIIDDNNIDCDFIPQSAFVYTQQDDYIQKIEDEIKTAQDLGINASYIDKIPFHIPIKAGIQFQNQAQFHPRKYVLELAKIINNNNVSIYENSRAVDIEKSGDFIITTNQRKKVRAKKIIIASHYPFYNKIGMYYARIYTERAYIVAIKAKEKYPGGMYINAEDPPRSLRHQNTKDGELILVVGENHKTGQSENTNKHYEALLEFANSLFTVENIPYCWSTQDCMTLDGIPYIGNFNSNTPDMYIATGFQKWGMTNSMVSAMLIKDLIVKGKSPWQEVYSPSRKAITASAKNFIAQNFNVAEQLLDGKLSSLPGDIDIEPGEGKVIKIDGDRVGVYKDEKGALHFVNTTCTHMGCELNWNSAEKTWDCPCHGSRFTYKGEIIEGPGVKPLKAGEDVDTIAKLFKDEF